VSRAYSCWTLNLLVHHLTSRLEKVTSEEFNVVNIFSVNQIGKLGSVDLLCCICHIVLLKLFKRPRTVNTFFECRILASPDMKILSKLTINLSLYKLCPYRYSGRACTEWRSNISSLGKMLTARGVTKIYFKSLLRGKEYISHERNKWVTVTLCQTQELCRKPEGRPKRRWESNLQILKDRGAGMWSR
jgi:hypothetical protein